jgi:hypothetical protein
MTKQKAIGFTFKLTPTGFLAFSTEHKKEVLSRKIQVQSLAGTRVEAKTKISLEKKLILEPIL